MAAPAPINANLVRIIFRYDPTTGTLIPTDLTAKAARKTDKRQWEIGAHRYALHRLVWAYHHPDAPNPYSVQFKDSDPTNTHIENLYAIDTNPRWLGHVKQVRMKLTAAGTVLEPTQTAADVMPVPPRPAVQRASVRLKEEMAARKQAELVGAFEGFEQEMNKRTTATALENVVANWDE
jgi:hypothetical protein